MNRNNGFMTAPDHAHPAFGGIVHFVLREAGDPDANPCRAALITAVHPSEDDGDFYHPRGPEPVDLVLPAFRRFLDRVHHSEGARGTGTWHWPDDSCR